MESDGSQCKKLTKHLYKLTDEELNPENVRLLAVQWAGECNGWIEKEEE